MDGSLILVLRRHRYKVLLATLIALLLGAPLVLGDLAAVTGESGRGLYFAFTLVFYLAGTVAATGLRGARLMITFLFLPALLLEIAELYYWPGQIALANHSIRIAFLIFVIVQLLRHLFHPERVTFDTLCASMCVYLLIGLLWSNAYVIIESVSAGSFLVTVQVGRDPPGLIGEADLNTRMLYFSYTTLTGIGFGDIVPTTHASRMFAVMEALVGQGYLLIMVSRLVGLHVSQSLLQAPATAREL